MTTTTLTLAAFLTARLDEDEAVARAASPGGWRSGDRYATGPTPTLEYVLAGPFNVPTFVSETGTLDAPVAVADATHIARHDPARVLADVEAKRRIVAEHSGHAPMCAWTHDSSASHGDYLCITLSLLALPFASHPDYRDEWKP